MDKELKARKLGSATVRKQRMQDRQKQKELLHDHREDRKRRMMRYSEAYSTGSSDNSRSNSPENDSATETPSECSVATPKTSVSPEIEIHLQSLSVSEEATSEKREMRDSDDSDTVLDRRRETMKPAMFTASLTRLCDFRYDRFSTFMEPVEVPKVEESDHSESSSEEQSDDDYSPIEVATPVAIRMPISRPSVISVVTTPGLEQGPQKFSVKNINTIMINAPKPKLQKIETVLNPRPLVSTEESSRDVRPIGISTPSSTQSLPAGEQPSIDNSLRKKASMPMLTRAHARMSTFKNLIKPQSISGPPPAVPIIPVSHQPRPSESLNNILLSSTSTHQTISSVVNKQNQPSPRRSLAEPAFLRVPAPASRPQTASTVSNQSTSSQRPPVPTFSAAPTPSPEPETSGEQDDNVSMSRKKSFSNLRRRSGSLGHALKFASGKTKSAAAELPPPVPAIKVPTNESVTSLSTPPPKTPRSARKSRMNLYSAFPPPVQKGAPIGLGLRM